MTEVDGGVGETDANGEDGLDIKFVVVLCKQILSPTTLLKYWWNISLVLNSIPNKTHDIKEIPS